MDHFYCTMMSFFVLLRDWSLYAITLWKKTAQAFEVWNDKRMTFSGELFL